MLTCTWARHQQLKLSKQLIFVTCAATANGGVGKRPANSSRTTQATRSKNAVKGASKSESREQPKPSSTTTKPVEAQAWDKTTPISFRPLVMPLCHACCCVCVCVHKIGKQIQHLNWCHVVFYNCARLLASSRVMYIVYAVVVDHSVCSFQIARCMKIRKPSSEMSWCSCSLSATVMVGGMDICTRLHVLIAYSFPQASFIM